MKKIPIYIRNDQLYYNQIKYVLKLIELNKKIQFEFVEDKSLARIIWDHTSEKAEIINFNFYQRLSEKSSLNSIFKATLKIEDKHSQIDQIATIFYMVNCLQEFNQTSNSFDQFERFQFKSSYQYKENCITENLVQNEIDRFCQKHDILGTTERSSFFLSHDIDNLYGSLFQDSKWAVTNLNIRALLKIIFMEVLRNPHWRNIDKILKINSEYDIKSTFFWLVNKGKGLNKIKNADYNIYNETALLELVNKAGSINGLHKSSSTMTIDEELAKIGFKDNCNRYHYLKFNVQSDWQKISDSQLTFDSSLGFAEHYGFRNSYGKVFQPYNILEDKPYQFIEAPLNFMDTTLHKYMNFPKDKIANTVIDFYEKNPTNCNISILWHNVYFTDFKYGSFLNQYKEILKFIYENKISCLTPNEITKANWIKW